jgi:hypothetical protein
MTSLVILAVLIALLAVVLMQLSKKKDTRAPAVRGPAQDLANLKVTEARAGDVISVAGAGDSMSDLDFTADRLVRYEAGTRRWFELSGPYRERRVALRVRGEDDVEVGLADGLRKPALEDLGLAEEDLAQMDERQNTADSFEYDGRVWLYRLSREVKTWRDDRPEPAGFYYWEFREDNGKRSISIRKTEGEPFAVSLYTDVPAADITVYRGSQA